VSLRSNGISFATDDERIRLYPNLFERVCRDELLLDHCKYDSFFRKNGRQQSIAVICAEPNIGSRGRREPRVAYEGGIHKRHAEFTRATLAVQILSNSNPIENRA